MSTDQRSAAIQAVANALHLNHCSEPDCDATDPYDRHDAAIAVAAAAPYLKAEALRQIAPYSSEARWVEDIANRMEAGEWP